MKQTPKWVLFDVGGVIFDYKSAFRDIAIYLNVDEKRVGEEIFKYIGPGELGEITFESVWEKVLESFQKHHEKEAVLSMWWDLNRWVTDTRILLQELNDAGYLLALFTNNWVGMGVKTAAFLPELSLMKTTFESSIEKLRKPDKTFYEIVEQRINSSGKHIFFIDDTENNIATANDMGWQTFHYQLNKDNGKKSNNKLRRLLLPKV